MKRLRQCPMRTLELSMASTCGGPKELRAEVEDRREQVVEVVRDASCQAPDGLQLLRLAKLLLEPAIVRDIARDDGHAIELSSGVAKSRMARAPRHSSR